jgi:hypothetical protein
MLNLQKRIEEALERVWPRNVCAGERIAFLVGNGLSRTASDLTPDLKGESWEGWIEDFLKPSEDESTVAPPSDKPLWPQPVTAQYLRSLLSPA